MSSTGLATTSLLAIGSVSLLAWLAIGKAKGAVKRSVWRLALAAGVVGVVLGGRRSGIFAQVGGGGRFVLVATAGLLVLSYLYLIRFCPSCGKLHRDFKLASCARCGAPLPDHGLTSRPRRAPRPPRRAESEEFRLRR